MTHTTETNTIELPTFDEAKTINEVFADLAKQLDYMKTLALSGKLDNAAVIFTYNNPDNSIDCQGLNRGDKRFFLNVASILIDQWGLQEIGTPDSDISH